MSEKKTAPLCERALLVSLQVSMWTGTRKDSTLSEEFCSEKGAERDAGSFFINFLPPKEIKELRNESSRLRNEWKSLTLPWGDGGMRILSSQEVFDYSTAMRKAIQRYDKAIETFANDRYPDIIKNMPDRLKGLLNGQTMPSAKEIRARYNARHSMFPVPNSNDFRLQAGIDGEEDIRKEVERSMMEATKTTIKAVWEQFASIVGKVEETLSNPDKKMTDKMIDKLLDFCIKLPRLNLTEDKDLEDMRVEVVQRLRNLQADVINDKKNEKERKDVAKAAKDCISKMKGFMG